MDSNLEDGRLPVGTGLPMNGAAKASPPSVGIPDAGGRQSLNPESGCELCADPENRMSDYPMYGVAPHECYWRKGPQFKIGESTLIPITTEHCFVPDLDPHEDWSHFGYPSACGTYYCPNCQADRYQRAWDALVARIGPPPTEIATPTSDAPKDAGLRIEFHQHDWIDGFAAFAPEATTVAPNSKAFCVLNVGAFLAAVETGDIPASELPYIVAESMMHEVIHVLEQWAGAEFNEDRVEALLARYRDSDRSGEAVETTGSTEGESAGLQGIAPASSALSDTEGR